MSDTNIEWTHREGTKGVTWNPTTGCDRISPGCDNCYALTLAKRLKAMGQAKYQNDGDPRTSGPGFGVTVHPDTLTDPLRWRDPRTVFVNSMSDLFHAKVSREFVARVFAVMATTPQHTYQILTKWPERMARLLVNDAEPLYRAIDSEVEAQKLLTATWPLRHVWLGTSIESDAYVRRADHLRATSAAVRFVSAEPLLGPLDDLDLTGIDWLIIGGESGPGARPMALDWVYELTAKARNADTAVFVKQLGSRWSQRTASLLPVDERASGKGGNWDHWPDDLRIREYPRGAEVVSRA